MKVGDLIRWILEDRSIGIIIGIFKHKNPVLVNYRIFTLNDNRFHGVYGSEIEVLKEEEA